MLNNNGVAASSQQQQQRSVVWSQSEFTFMTVQLECAALSSQDVIHLSLLFGLEEDEEKDRNQQQEAGSSHHSYNQPCEGGVCGKKESQRNLL